MIISGDRAPRFTALDEAIRRLDPAALPALHRLVAEFEKIADDRAPDEAAIWRGLGVALALQQLEHAEDERRWSGELRRPAGPPDSGDAA